MNTNVISILNKIEVDGLVFNTFKNDEGIHIFMKHILLLLAFIFNYMTHRSMLW